MNQINKMMAGAAVWACASAVMAAAASDTDVKALQEQMELLKLQVEQLQSELVAVTGATEGETQKDPQKVAAHLNDLTVDPEYNGFVRVPNTDVIAKLNAIVRLDMMSDSKNTGNDYRFITAKIPVGSDPQRGGGQQFNMNANGSQLRLDIQAPDAPGKPRFYYQNDFYGDNDSAMNYRLQHMYVRYYNLLMGFTTGLFEDPDVWPDTVDYEGPNAVNYARRALVHYKQPIGEHWLATFGVEDPDIYVEPSSPDDRADTPMPDVGANIRWQKEDVGHMQAAGIVRYIGVNSAVNRDDHCMGWGFNVGGSYQLTPHDKLTGLVNAGKGIGGMGNDSSFVDSDAAYDAAGNLEALPYCSVLMALTHRWSPTWRSTFSYGFVTIDNTNGQAGEAYHDTTYGSANIICQVREQMSVGLEGLYGEKETNDGNSGDVFRIQLGLVYSVF